MQNRKPGTGRSEKISESMRARVPRRAVGAIALAVLGVVALPQAETRGASGTWTQNASSAWGTTTNWSGGIVASGAGFTADFSTLNIGTSTRIVTIDAATGSRTIGSLLIGDTNTSHSYTIAADSGFGLTFDNGASAAVLTQTSTSLTTSITAPITLASNLSFTNNHATNALTINAAVGESGGARSITSLGAGQLILRGAGANSFSGGVIVKAGTVSALDAGASPFGTGVITLGDSAPGSTAAATLSSGSTAIIANAINVVAGGTGVRTISSFSSGSNSALFGGTITLATNLNILGFSAGNITLGGPVTGSGNIVVNNNLLAGGGSISFNGQVNHAGSITNIGTTSRATRLVGVVGPNITAVTQNSTGTGSLTLLAANTYTADTTLQQGALNIAHTQALQFSTLNNLGGTVNYTGLYNTFGGLKGSADVALPASVLYVGHNNSSNTFSGILGGGGSFSKVGSGTQTLTGLNTYTGTTAIRGGTLIAGGDVPSAAVSVLGNATTPILVGDTTSPLAGGAVKAATTAAIALTGLQTIDGVTLVVGDRVLVKDQASTAQNGVYVVDALTWTRAPDADSSAELAYGHQISVAAGGVANGGKAFFGATNVPIVVNSSSLHYVVDQVNPSANVAFLTNGAFTIGRDLTVAANGSAGTSSIGATNAAASTATYSGSILLNREVVLSSANAGATTAFTGIIDDGAATAGVVISGAGTVRLGSATGSVYDGNTTVSSGVLEIANISGSATGSGSVQVGSGAKLKGNGSVAGNILVQSGGTLSPGNSPGLLVSGSDVTLGGGSTLEVEIAGILAGSEYDVVRLNGVATLGDGLAETAFAQLQLAIAESFTPSTGDRFVLLDNISEGGINVGKFQYGLNVLDENEIFTVGAHSFQINYNTDGLLSEPTASNDVVLTVVPEPAMLGMLALGAGLLARRRRK